MSSAIAAVTKANGVPPASPFAELLRRSRFASYDPAIRQTYSSPAAYAHRGDWGLKRPIALRRRNAFISLSSFESPAHFTEWNHAENQVRFIRRVEEMGVTPRTSTSSNWFHGLGKAKDVWAADSEFCPGESHVLKLGQEKQTHIEADLLGLGNRGPGYYGANRPHQRKDKPLGAHVMPNFGAMSHKKFQRYLTKLRALRPKFQQYLQMRDEPITKSLYELAQDSLSDHHIQFLLHHTAQEFQDHSSLQIEQQPHRNAGLMYAHPSPLNSHFTTEAQPGIVLQVNEKKNFSNFSKPTDSYLVSFGGLSCIVQRKNAGGKVPLLDRESEQGVDKSKLDASVGYMRVRSLELDTPPRVVGRRAQGIKAVKHNTEVIINSPHYEFGIDNPHEPGTPEYIAAEARGMQSRPSHFPKRDRRLKSSFELKYSGRTRPKSREDSKKVLATLREMVNNEPRR